MVKWRYMDSMHHRRNAGQKTKHGFTIVELLIVIVVIGILAAITIIAYNGITQKARVASVMSDLENASKVLKIDQTLNSIYPTGMDCSASPAAGTECLKSTAGVSYSNYIAVNGLTSSLYCLTATVGSVNYYATQDSAPTPGLCAANIITNPSFETTVNDWWNNFGAGGAGTAAQSTVSPVSGNYVKRMTWTTAPTGVIQTGINQTPIGYAVKPGKMYTFSFSLRQSWSSSEMASIIFKDASSNTVGSLSGSPVVMTVGQWSRISVSFTAPANAVFYSIYNQSTSGLPVVGSTLDIDAAMLTESPALLTYGDGDTAGWAWSGSAHSSISVGPAQ